ncbi:MAG: Hpt domain-containing protein, partial [Deltaproteobacteria bacterium]|nr:Hpt domain-containing protein [Deltaproteobacteria bacterium]
MMDVSLLDDFGVEAGEHLAYLEAGLLRLETEPGDSDVLNEVFRAVHSIKGAANFVGLERFATLTHRLENLLDLLRQGRRQVTREIIDVLMDAKDRMVLLADELQRSGVEAAAVDDLVERVTRLTEESAAGGGAGGKKRCAEAVCEKAAVQPDEEVAIDEAYDRELFEIFIRQLTEN